MEKPVTWTVLLRRYLLREINQILAIIISWFIINKLSGMIPGLYHWKRLLFPVDENLCLSETQSLY